MAEHFISRIDAENDLLACAAYLAESIPPGETHAAAVATVVPYYLENSNVDLAAELANSVDDPFTRDRLLIGVAAKCAELDDDEYAMQLVEAIEDPGFQSQGYEQLGSIKAQKGELEKAGEIITMMLHPDAVLGRIAIRQVSDRDDEAAMRTIGEIEFPRDAVMALCAIAAEKIVGGDNEKAAECLSLAEGKTAEIEHDEERIRSFCEIANLYVDAGDKGRAFQVYETARNEAENLDGTQRDPLLAQVAIGFLSAGSVDLADRTLDAISDKTQIASVVVAFARDHWHKEERDEAIEALDEAYEILRSQHENETRDSRAKFVMMGTVAGQFAGFQKLERAIEVADSIPDDTQKTNALSQIAQIAATQGEYAVADQAASEIKGELDRALTIMAMGRNAKNAGDIEKADSLLNSASNAIANLPDPSARYTALTELCKVHFANDNATAAVEAFDRSFSTVLEIRNSNFKISGLAEMSKILRDFGLDMTDERREVLRRFLQA